MAKAKTYNYEQYILIPPILDRYLDGVYQQDGEIVASLSTDLDGIDFFHPTATTPQGDYCNPVAHPGLTAEYNDAHARHNPFIMGNTGRGDPLASFALSSNGLYIPTVCGLGTSFWDPATGGITMLRNDPQAETLCQQVMNVYANWGNGRGRGRTQQMCADNRRQGVNILTNLLSQSQVNSTIQELQQLFTPIVAGSHLQVLPNPTSREPNLDILNPVMLSEGKGTGIHHLLQYVNPATNVLIAVDDGKQWLQQVLNVAWQYLGRRLKVVICFYVDYNMSTIPTQAEMDAEFQATGMVTLPGADHTMNCWYSCFRQLRAKL